MSRVYVGNLPIDIREREVEDLFSKCVLLRSCAAFGLGAARLSHFSASLYSLYSLGTQVRQD